MIFMTLRRAVALLGEEYQELYGTGEFMFQTRFCACSVQLIISFIFHLYILIAGLIVSGYDMISV